MAAWIVPLWLAVARMKGGSFDGGGEIVRRSMV